MRTLVIIPTYCEAGSVETVIINVLEVSPEIRVLVIDDNSGDGTGAIVQKLSERDGRVSLLSRPSKMGLGSAYKTGFKWAFEHDFEIVVEFDADGSHQASELPALLEAVEEGSDVALGSRWIDGGKIVGWPLVRQWISKTGTKVARLCLGSKLRDLTSGFRAIRTSIIKKIDLETISSNGYGFQVESAWRMEQAGAKIVEVPITFVERKTGRSKMTLGIVVEALFMVLRLGIARIVSQFL